jgi:hypothetical protein
LGAQLRGPASSVMAATNELWRGTKLRALS